VYRVKSGQKLFDKAAFVRFYTFKIKNFDEIPLLLRKKRYICAILY